MSLPSMPKDPSTIKVPECPTIEETYVIHEHDVKVPHCGSLKVFVQGNIEDRHGKTVFITCHDIGTNHKSWFPFIDHASMDSVRERSIFIHVCLPGQEDDAQDLPDNFQFPTFEHVAQDLSAVVDHFNVKGVIAMGEGAGANIIIHFAETFNILFKKMAQNKRLRVHFPNKILGIVLIHCTALTQSVLEFLGNKVTNWKIGQRGMNNSAYDYLLCHKFGPNYDKKDARVVIHLNDIKLHLNPSNLHCYLEAYLQRTDVDNLAEKLTVDTLLVAGTKSSHSQGMHAMHSTMNKLKTTLLVVEEAIDVLYESPQKVARALILFCKGCGALSGVGIPGMERQRTVSGSMEEADKPRKLSLSINRTIEKVPE